MKPNKRLEIQNYRDDVRKWYANYSMKDLILAQKRTNPDSIEHDVLSAMIKDKNIPSTKYRR